MPIHPTRSAWVENNLQPPPLLKPWRMRKQASPGRHAGKAHRSDANDRSIIALHGAGAVIGEISMIDGLPRVATAQALNECRLDAIARDAFWACLRDHPEMSAGLITILAGRLRRAGETTAWASLLQARARLARAMLRIADVAGVDVGANRQAIAVPMTRADIAVMAGVSREEASRGPQRLAKGGDDHGTFHYNANRTRARVQLSRTSRPWGAFYRT
jgi:CRP/FNR family transcriptional regulator, cyclic AMP receptor protein